MGVVWTFLLSSILSPLSPSLLETARYRLKYCLKGPLNPKPTNQQPKNPELFNSIRDNLPILQEDETMNQILQEFQIIKSKRQPRNLKQLITRAKFNDANESPNIRKYNKSNCGLCDHLITENECAFQCRKPFKAKYSMSCEVKNLIYVIRCSVCHEEYIGETGDTLVTESPFTSNRLEMYPLECYM